MEGIIVTVCKNPADCAVAQVNTSVLLFPGGTRSGPSTEPLICMSVWNGRPSAATSYEGIGNELKAAEGEEEGPSILAEEEMYNK